jgi:hypothetical protein
MLDIEGLSYRENVRKANRSFHIVMSGVVAVTVLFFVALRYYAITRGREAHARFMRQCMEDHKEYECTALWRAGDRASPDLIVIPIPTGR